MKTCVAILLLSCVACYSYSIQPPPEPPKYDETAIMEEQYDETVVMEDSNCYFRAELQDCKKGHTITTYVEENVMMLELKEERKNVCLQAKCMKIDSRQVLKGNLLIGGPNVQASPALLEQGTTAKLHSDEPTCLRDSNIVVRVKCFEMKPIEDLDDSGKGNVNVTLIQEVGGDYDHSSLQSIDQQTQFITWFQTTMQVKCPPRYGLYFISSQHSNYFEDRIFNLKCKYVVPVNFNHCYWTGYQNEFDLPLSAHCGADYIMNGLYSIYSDFHKDRRFSLLCCRAPGYTTKSCSLTNYLNVFDGFMYYAVGGNQILTGMHSYHIDFYEDRRYKMSACSYSAA